MSASLLDLNLLIALAWPNHIHHRTAREWFRALGTAPWATCPFTQAGFIRLSSNPRVVDPATNPEQALQELRQLTQIGHHVFWPDDLDLTSQDVSFRLALGHRQVTDAYLLGLVIRHGGQLVTLDRSITDLLPAASPHRERVYVLGQ